MLELLRCYAVSSGEEIPTLRLNVASPFSGSGSTRTLLLLPVLGLPDNEDEGFTSLRNADNDSPVDKA
jgi:hypothetical protein